MGVQRTRRRSHRLQSRGPDVRHLRRRDQRFRHQSQGTGTGPSALQGASDRPRPPGPGPPLLGAAGQPLRRHGGGPPRNLGLRVSQPLAHVGRPQDRASLGGQQRTGPLGAGLSGRTGSQLRLERLRGQPHLLCQPRAGTDSGFQAPAGTPALRSPLHDRGPGLLRLPVPGAVGSLHLRRLFHRQDMGRQGRGPGTRVAQRAGRHPPGHRRLRGGRRRQPAGARLSRPGKGRPPLPGGQRRARQQRPVPPAPEPDRAVCLGRRPSVGTRDDPLLGERPPVVGRRLQGAVSLSAAGRGSGRRPEPGRPRRHDRQRRLELPRPDRAGQVVRIRLGKRRRRRAALDRDPLAHPAARRMGRLFLCLEPGTDRSPPGRERRTECLRRNQPGRRREAAGWTGAFPAGASAWSVTAGPPTSSWGCRRPR